MKTRQSILAAAITSAIFSSVVYAENNNATSLEEVEVITVTSDFRDTNLQKIPASLSVLSAQDIANLNAQNLEEVISIAPNVNFSAGTQRARYYQIRGIGERSQFREPINPSVGIIIDDIDFTGVGSIASLFDVNQTEVFRGPQGTRFGANALAGLINITTNAPSNDFEGAAKLTAGNYGSYGAGLALSGPATDSVNYRFALEKYQSDGFIDNIHLNRDDTNDRDELTARGKLAITLSDDHHLDLGLYYFDFDNGYDAFSLDNNRQTRSDQPGFDRQETYALSAKSHYSGFDFGELVTIVTHADSDIDYGYDEDWSFVGLHPFEYSSTDHYFREKTSSTFELRAVSNNQSKLFNGTTAWVAGLYAKTESEELLREYTFADSDFGSNFDTDTIAAYAQLDSQLTEKLTLTSGLRLEERSADYDNTEGLTFSPDDTMVGGKLVLSYQQTEQALIFASINRGYKTGGVNTQGSLPAELREFDSEYLWNYELGYNYSFDDNSGYLRVTAFYMDRKDMQVNSNYIDVRPDGSAEFISYFGNAAEGKNQGIEIDASWQLSERSEIYGAFGYLDTELIDYFNQDGVDLTGRDQAHAPNYQATLGVNAFINDQVTFNVNIIAKDDFYFSDSHNEQSDGYETLNASLTYEMSDWQVKIWARNITDEDYKTRGFFFGNDPRDGYQAKQYYQLGEPRVYGVTLDYQF